MALVRIDSPLKLVATYAMVGSAWIVASDRWAAWWGGGSFWAFGIDTLKGLLFIAVTTGLLYALTRRLLREHGRTTAALHESEARLALALEAGNQGLFDFNVQSGAVLVNETYARMLGYDPAGFQESADRWRERLHADDRVAVTQLLDHYLAGRLEAYRVEFRLRTKAGGWIWIQSVGRIVERDAAGRPYRMIGTHTDITDRKLAEDRRELSAQFVQAALNSLSSSIAILDGHGVILAVNQAWRDFARENAGRPEAVGEGVNYLEVADRAEGEDAGHGRAMAAGLRAVLAGECAEFALEYPCDSPERSRWFIGRVTRFVGPGSGRLVVAHEDISARRLAAAALHASEERLKLALEATNLGLFDLNVQTGEAVVNDTYARMLGYDPATFRETEAAWRERVHPNDREPALRHFADYVAAGGAGSFQAEFRMRTAAGDWRWILAMGRIVERDEAGRPRRMLAVQLDITERKGAEERTRDALEFARTVLHSSPVGVVTYRNDGMAMTANAAAARIVGTDMPGLLGQNFRQLESWQRHGLRAAAEQALATGREAVHRGPFVSTFGRSLWIESRFVPFHFLGETHLLVLINDETERHLTSETLNLLNAAVQASPSGWVITDAKGIIQFVNPGFTVMTGYSAAEAVGRSTSILKSGRQTAAFYAAMWSTIRRGEVWHGELENCRKDGTFYQEQMTIAPVRDPQGRIAHYVAVKHDISEQKKLEQQITRAQRLEAIGMLASGIAHDLNNILAPITLALELLKLKYPDAEGRKILDMIEHSAQRGTGIVRQVLTFARGVDGARAEVFPKHLLKDVGSLAEETFPRNLRIEVEAAPEVYPVMGDITQLHQVILNLAVNARDAMPAGGVLRLAAFNVTLEHEREFGALRLPPGPYVTLLVGDTGTGMPPEVQERIFEPFFTTKPLGKGTGLGLATVYGIVRSHGGLIEVHSRVGEGTEFRVLLPAVTAETAGPRESRPPGAAPLTGGGRRVLVVDDEEAIRLVTAEALERHGFVVEMAADGAEGLEKYRRAGGDFAAVLTDVMMPRLNGYQLAEEIRRTDPRVPIIASSGVTAEVGTEGPDPQLAKLGIRTLLTKPYSEQHLLDALAAELNRRDKRG